MLLPAVERPAHALGGLGGPGWADIPLSGCPVQIMRRWSDPAGEYDVNLLANIELCVPAGSKPMH